MRFARRHLTNTAAIANHERALALARCSGDGLAEAVSLKYLSFAQRRTGDYAACATNLTRTLELYRGLGNRLGEGDALHNLGDLHTLTGDYLAADASHQQALEIFRDLGSVTATCTRAIPAKPRVTCGKHSRSTSASAPLPHDAWKEPSATPG